MNENVTLIPARIRAGNRISKEENKPKLRIAAYCRVSTDSDEQAGSYEMIDDCMAGKVDMIITKSISRFARNTIDCLKYVRQLREKNIAIIFEKKDFYTAKMPINAVITALSKEAWCLVGVLIYVTQ